jgi:cytochrome c oxidase subunit II
MTKATHLVWRPLLRLWVAAILLLSFGVPALAQDAGTASANTPGRAPAGVVEAPHNWQIGMQPPASPVQVRIEHLNTLVAWIITIITLFVGILLAYVIWRYRASANPQASRVSHHTWLEVTWTVLPALVLVLIAIPSFRLVYYEDRAANPDMTIKVTGHQWYWNYEYPDQDNLQFDSYMVQDEDLKPGQLRHLSVDNPLVVPVGKTIRVLQTSGDVIHSFFIPSLGMQRYAIPGRVIETWVRADKVGTFFGQCNQICGTNHSVMPIEVRAVPQSDFDAWVQEAKKKFAANVAPVNMAPPGGETRLAAAAVAR